MVYTLIRIIISKYIQRILTSMESLLAGYSTVFFIFFSFLSLQSSVRRLYRKQKRHPFRNASYSLNLCPHGNTPCRDGMLLPRFHPACFPWKTILIHVMITESPCRIKAAPRWSSVSRNIKALAPYGLLSEVTAQPTVLINAFSYIAYSTSAKRGVSRQISRAACPKLLRRLS